MKRCKKWLLPLTVVVIILCLVLSMITGCVSDALVDYQTDGDSDRPLVPIAGEPVVFRLGGSSWFNPNMPRAPPSLGEVFHPSGNPFASSFSDTKDVRTATIVVAAADSKHYFDVDYRCNGTADQVEIMAALNAITPGQPGGGRVVLLDGTFTINDTIYFPVTYGVFLEGQGCWSTRIDLAAGSDCDMIDFSPTSQTLFGGVKHLMLYGNKNNQASGRGIFTTSVDGGIPADLNFEGVMVTDCKEEGFYLFDTWGYHITDCLSEYNEGSGLFLNGQETYIVNFFSAYNDGDGFSLSGSYNHYTNLHSWGNGEDGIYIKDDYSSFTGISVFNWGSEAADTHIGVNVFSGAICNSIAGVDVRGTTNGNKSWIGIQLNGDDNAFSALKVVGCTNDGIEINGDNNLVQGNCLGNATVAGTNLDDNGYNNSTITLINITGQAKLWLPLKVKPNITRWVVPGWLVDGAEAASPTAETVYYQPIYVTEDTTYIRVAIQVTVGAVGSAEIWLYQWEDGLPTAKIADLGDIADTNLVQLHQIVISQALVANTYYFLAIRFTANPTCLAADDRSVLLSPVSGSGTSFMYLGGVILTVASATLTDPATAPTGSSDVNSLFMNMREN